MYPTLRAEMARRGIKLKDLASDPGINCTTSTMSLKLKGESPLTLGEAVRIKKILDDVRETNLTLDELYQTVEEA